MTARESMFAAIDECRYSADAAVDVAEVLAGMPDDLRDIIARLNKALSPSPQGEGYAIEIEKHVPLAAGHAAEAVRKLAGTAAVIDAVTFEHDLQQYTTEVSGRAERLREAMPLLTRALEIIDPSVEQYPAMAADLEEFARRGAEIVGDTKT